MWQVGNGVRFGDRFPFFWLYAIGGLVIVATSAALCFPAGRIGVAVFAAVVASVATPRRYAVALAVAGTVAGFVLIPVIATQGAALVVPAAVLGLALLAVIKRWKSLRAPRHLLTMLMFFGLLVMSTALFSRTTSPLLIALLLAVAALPTFFLAANLTSKELRALSAAVFVLLGVQLVLAFAEATGMITAIYDISADRAQGIMAAQKNTVVSEWSRATGTMLHALPLGFLAVTAAALATVRTATFRWSWRVRMLVFGMAAATCVFASARSSLIVLALLAVLTFPAGRRLSRFLQSALVCAAVLALLVSNGFFDSRQVVDLLSSGSVVHRLGVVSMIPLMGREPLINLFIGSGHDAVSILRHLMPADGWMAVDNQFISTVLMTGIVGLALLITILVAAWRNAPEWRPALMAQVAMFAIFDVALWQSSLVLLMVVLGAMLAKREGPPAAAIVPAADRKRRHTPRLVTPR